MVGIMIIQQLGELKEKAVKTLKESSSLELLEHARINFLGKKGEITAILSQMGKLPAEERPKVGQVANEVRAFIEEQIKVKKEELSAAALEKRLSEESLDVTLPGTARKIGKKHPVSIVLDEITDAFVSMGYSIVTGPEVEYDYYNFEALNIPKNHPARDSQDTFYFNPEMLLRSQTSPVQVRVMEQTKPPIKILAPGKVYRIDDVDATHSPIFHQIEGLVVDKDISMSHLKGSLDVIAHKLFGSNVRTRIRPDYFPFTEPSAEIAVSCFICGGEGCPFCKHEGWIELGGAGMVNPKVLKGCGIDPDEYTGFAFGMGLERLVMGRYKITDIRMFFENDVRFLENF